MVKSKERIYNQYLTARAFNEKRITNFDDKTYEDGVLDTLAWILEISLDEPLSDGILDDETIELDYEKQNYFFY